MNSKRLIDILARNQSVIESQIDGITHSDSLLQLPFRGNCLNWVLGHLAISRDGMLSALGEKPVLVEKEQEIYARGSDPITDGVRAIPLETLADAMKTSSAKIKTVLDQCAEKDLASPYDLKRNQTLGDWIEFLLWHETYHTGQLEYLRQLTGVNDSVIP
ncbi:MAG: DinB family protein [Anaerolineales bacterium]|nr:DinB family protein [Anaerolineales bacterium]